jgi:DNA-binding CsgD family transcriptional regulator/tetratricopeptide (TPR) repeat protein/Mrp family chromosome partitioning ATPase
VLDVSLGRLVGRTAELGRLLDQLDAAASGRPVVTLISGDAGVGKTRLVTELAAKARERGFAVLSGRCAELGDAVPYLPLADALRDATTGPSPRGLLLDALAARPVLSRLLPDRDAGQPAGGDLPGLVQQQLFGAVLGMLAELAGASPVLLILEDLHWADRSTRDLLTFLSRMLHSERLAVVATYRTDDMHRRHPLRPLVAELLRLPGVSSIELGPLTASAMAEHLTTLSRQPLDAAAIGQMITRAEGNAYYAEELLAASVAGSDLPAGLADLLLARMERLSAAAQQVLRTAAVTGRRVDDELVRLASGLDAASYDDAVREAVAHQLLVPDGAQGFSFRHALLREVVYADLLPGERTRLHARLAELLADQARLAGAPGTAAELAHHYLASHDIPGAFSASILAGQEAERLAAPAEAHRHYDQALSLWERVSEPEKLGGIGRGKLALRSALSAADGGDEARAAAQLRRLLGYLGADADPTLLCRVHERLAYFLMDLDEESAALAAAQAAVDALPPDPPRWEYARALATHARALLSLPDKEPARSRAKQARTAAKAAGAPWVEADALVTLGLISERSGKIADAISLFTRAHREAAVAKVLGVELRAAFQLARVQLEQGDLAGASGTAHEGTSRARAAGLGLAPYGYDLQYLHFLAHYSDGAWDHAQQIAEGFAVRVTSVHEARLSAMALFVAVARGLSHDVDERLGWLEPMFARDSFTEYVARGLLAERALWQGDAATAVAEIEATIRAVDSWDEGYRGPYVIRVAAVGIGALADIAAGARAAGENERAASAVEAASAMLRIARAGAANPRSPDYELGVDGRGWLARAEAEWLRASGGNDPAAWQRVVGAFGMGFVYETARSRWRLAEALAESGDREAARQEWLLAAAAADQLHAAPLQAALADLGRRARIGSSAAGAGAGPGQAGGQPWAGSRGRGPLAGLTERELEVLQLLAAGHSNKEIGSELFISPKTASVHVSNILAKLSAGSRTEAAAIAHGQGLGMPAPR